MVYKNTYVFFYFLVLRPPSVSTSSLCLLSLQETLLKEAGIPIPADFDGSRKSFTLPADEKRCAIGVLLLVSFKL